MCVCVYLCMRMWVLVCVCDCGCVCVCVCGWVSMCLSECVFEWVCVFVWSVMVFGTASRLHFLQTNRHTSARESLPLRESLVVRVCVNHLWTIRKWILLELPLMVICMSSPVKSTCTVRLLWPNACVINHTVLLVCYGCMYHFIEKHCGVCP